MSFMPTMGRETREALAASTHHQPLSDEQLRLLAPAIFREERGETTSARYSQVKTSQVLEAMREANFLPVHAKQTGDGDSGRHLVRFRRTGQEKTVGGTVPEVALLNSHDGTSSYRLLAGLFRLVCENGLVVATSLVADVRVLHVGNVAEKVVAGSQLVIEGATRSADVAGKWRDRLLTDAERIEFANRAISLRYDAEQLASMELGARQVLQVRRQDDASRDLWSTFNVAQENLARGVLRFLRTGSDGRQRRDRTRGIGAIQADVKFNQNLWSLATEFAEAA